MYYHPWFLPPSKKYIKNIYCKTKYKSFKETAQAVKESGAEMVTVAVRRVNILDKKKPA